MAAITPLRGTSVLIKVGDGASPEVFGHPCLINTKRGIKFTSSTNKIIVPDCDNPDDPAWTQVMKDSLSASIDGAGTLDNVAATLLIYDTWFRDEDTKNVKIYLGTAGHWTGAFALTAWDVMGDRNQNAQVSLTLESDGVLSPFTTP